MASPRKSAQNTATKAKSTKGSHSAGGQKSPAKKSAQPRRGKYDVDLQLLSPRTGDQIGTDFEVYVTCSMDDVIVTATSTTGATAPPCGKITDGSFSGTFIGATPGTGKSVTVTGDQANPTSVSDLTVLGAAPIGPVITILGAAITRAAVPAGSTGSRTVTIRGRYQAALFYAEPSITVQLESPPGTTAQTSPAILDHPQNSPGKGRWSARFPSVDSGTNGKHYSVVAYMEETFPVLDVTVKTAKTSRGHKVG